MWAQVQAQLHSYSEVRPVSLTVDFSSVTFCCEDADIGRAESVIGQMTMKKQERLKGLEDGQKSDYNDGPWN